jgi:phosphohistidine swiveling domain-containing protein
MTIGILEDMIDLRNAADAAIELVGGKAAGLGHLLNLGLNVPAGFVIPSTAGVNGPPPAGLEEAIDRLRAKHELVRFAVRSSASGEDSERASWAGQFETVLSVPSGRVWDAVQTCRASLRSSRAIGYADTRRLQRPDRMAVVVQEMVDAAKAGTIFTRGLADDDALVIEAVRGLGEALMAGDVTPENITVERDGTVRAVYEGEDQLGAVLDEVEIGKLTTLGIEIESAFERPMDIEWALTESGELFVLQARAVTATVSNTERPYASWTEDDLFRWGPTAGRYFYISDFVVAACEISTVAKGGTLPWTILTFDDAHQMVWLSTSSGWHSLAEHCFREVCLDDNAMSELRRRYDSVCPKVESFFNVDWENLDRERLQTEGERFYAEVHEFWLSTLPAELGNYGGEKILDQALHEHVPHALVRAELTRMLFETDGLSGEQKKRLDLATADEVRDHWQAYRFDLSSYLGPHERSPEEFEHEKRELTPAGVEAMLRHVEAADTARKRSIESLALPAEAVRIGRRLAETLAWQEERKRVANRLMAIKGQILGRASRLLRVDEAALHRLGFYEMLALLEGNVTLRAVLNERPALLFRTEIERLAESEGRMLWLSFAHPAMEDPRAGSIVGGKVAFAAPAPITGIARIVTDPGANLEFNEGDILFAPRTAPELELLMRRAGSVVTDSGGQTSHTAVFCRENSLPGIVGLPNATRHVKDGQHVTFCASRVDSPGTIYLHGPEAAEVDGREE